MEALSYGQLRSLEVLCALSGKLFSESPTKETLEGLIEQRDLLREEPFSTVVPMPAQALYECLGQLHSEEETASFLKEIAQDYTYLFYMVGTSHTSPYESVYRTDDRTMFGPTTLEVRDFYHSYGMQIPKEGSEPDDHYGREMAFVALLFSQAAEAVESGNQQQSDALLSEIGAFVSDHLLVFAPTYLANVGTRAQSKFFQIVANMSAVIISFIAETLGVEASEKLDESFRL